MPYIAQYKRDELNDGVPPMNVGSLNYVLTKLILRYLRNRCLSYETCNEIVGVLDNVKDEFKRRVQYPYEDKKKKENGDVYEGI